MKQSAITVEVHLMVLDYDLDPVTAKFVMSYSTQNQGKEVQFAD